MSELRKDPITERWVVISTDREKRPNDFDNPPLDPPRPYKCPFCHGNEHMTPPEIHALRPDGGHPNSPDWSVRVVPNKYPALGVDKPLEKKGVGMYDTMTAFGAHEVVIETPEHDKSIDQLSLQHLTRVMGIYQDRITDLQQDKRFRYVLLFRNEGKEAGATLPHPHSQIIATPITPKRVKEELMGAEAYFKAKERCVFCDMISFERESGERIVYENDHFISFCPYASRFPFETWILPKTHQLHFHASRENISDLAQAFKATMQKLQVALNRPQYNFTLHTAPNLFPRRGYWYTIHEDYHWHFEIMPRLTRTAGFEWGTGFYINPTAPEVAASYLREAGAPV